jgi:hypothetical protein
MTGRGAWLVLAAMAWTGHSVTGLPTYTMNCSLGP